MSLHQAPTGLDRAIHCWGDSLTESTSGITSPYATRYPTVLGTLFTPQRTVYNGGVGGETAAQIATRQLAYMPVNNVINVIEAGRNSVLSLTAAAIVATIQTMVAHVSDDRYLVWTVPFKTDGTEDADDANGILVQTLNDLIIATYQDNYIDIAALLGRDDALRVDGLHPTGAGYALIAAAIYDRIVAEGW